MFCPSVHPHWVKQSLQPAWPCSKFIWPVLTVQGRCHSLFPSFSFFLPSLWKEGFHTQIAHGIRASRCQISVWKVRKGKSDDWTWILEESILPPTIMHWELSKIWKYFFVSPHMSLWIFTGICHTSWPESPHSNLPRRKQIPLHKWVLLSVYLC